MSRMCGVFFVALAAANCDGMTFSSDSFSDDAGYESEEVSPDALCVDSSQSARGKVVLEASRSGHPCVETNRFSATLLNGDSVDVVLYGDAGVEYCIEVERKSGFLEICASSGSVMRQRDIFTWCVTAQGEGSEDMRVRSLTASGSFELIVP